MTERYQEGSDGPQRLYTRRQVLGYGVAGAAGAAVTCGPLGVIVGWIGKDITDGNGLDSTASQNQSSTAPEAATTIARQPEASSAPPINAIREAEAIIDNAVEGDTLVLQNLPIHGFIRVTASVPLTSATAVEHYAIMAVPTADGQQAALYSAVSGAKCLYDAAVKQDLLDTREGETNADAAVAKWSLKKQMNVRNAHVEVGNNVPGTDGGKILHITSYTPEGEEAEVACNSDTNAAARIVIEQAFLRALETQQR